MKEEYIYSEVPAGRPAPLFLRRVSWGAIFAGLVVTLVLQIVLSVLGVAIGASTIDPFKDGQSAKTYGVGSAIWLGLSSIISIFSGACVAGRLSGGPRTTDGLLHGVATWATATLLSVFVLTTAVGSIVGGTAKLLGQTLSTGMQGASSGANAGGTGSGISEEIKQEAKKVLPQGGSAQGEADKDLMGQVQQNPELGAILTRMFNRGGAAADPQDREAAINLLTSQGNMSREEAEANINRWEQQYQQTKSQVKEKTREMGAAAASGTAKAAWWSFAFLVLSACAAAFGGLLGTRGLSYIRPQGPAPAAT